MPSPLRECCMPRQLLLPAKAFPSTPRHTLAQPFNPCAVFFRRSLVLWICSLMFKTKTTTSFPIADGSIMAKICAVNRIATCMLSRCVGLAELSAEFQLSLVCAKFCQRSCGLLCAERDGRSSIGNEWYSQLVLLKIGRWVEVDLHLYSGPCPESSVKGHDCLSPGSSAVYFLSRRL